jgi:hypothetical protein
MIDADCWEGFMKYAVEIGSGTMTYVINFIDWFRHSKVDRGDTQTRWRSHMPTLEKWAKKRYTSLYRIVRGWKIETVCLQVIFSHCDVHGLMNSFSFIAQQNTQQQ